ncbi:hypothetical protein Gasu2_21760 [Galdieria sulphuraria]|nr:hypothetical protein Gasu2_21760 [Galdieria sulphuraria]
MDLRQEQKRILSPSIDIEKLAKREQNTEESLLSTNRSLLTKSLFHVDTTFPAMYKSNKGRTAFDYSTEDTDNKCKGSWNSFLVERDSFCWVVVNERNRSSTRSCTTKRKRRTT